MFVHDPHTNRLSLQPGKHPPWIRKTYGQSGATFKKADVWTYCLDCKQRFCRDGQQRPKAHLPFRDRASQFNLKPHERCLAKENAPLDLSEAQNTQNTQPEPEPDVDKADAEDAPLEDGPEDVALPIGEDDDVDEEIVPDAPPATAFPTLEEYKRKWSQELAAHSKPIASTPFSFSCLVPRPIPNLWQDCRGPSRV